MSTLLDVHHANEIVWTMTNDGNLRAWRVNKGGGLEETSVEEAIAEEKG